MISNGIYQQNKKEDTLFCVHFWYNYNREMNELTNSTTILFKLLFH